MDDEIPLKRMDDIPITRLDDIPLTILDDIQSSMDPNALVNRVFMMQSVEKNIPINQIIEQQYK